MLRMGKMLLVLAVVGGVAEISPRIVEACHRHQVGGNCNRCQRVAPQCQCGMVPAPVMTPPVMHIQPQPCATMQPVTRTEIRREARVIEVPVTTHRQVTVDEGSYQTVWVPKVVTKTVPETTIQRHVMYQDVPFQVTQHVPVVQTRMVPATTMVTVPYSPGVAVGMTPVPEIYATPVASQPTTVAQQPATETGSSSWSKVPSQQSGASAEPIQKQSYEQAAPTFSARTISTPTAATAWGAHFGTRR